MTGRLGWLTPSDLAEQLGQTERWVRDKMALPQGHKDHIPSLKIGNSRWFTPDCERLLHERKLSPPTADPAGFGLKTRTRAKSP